MFKLKIIGYDMCVYFVQFMSLCISQRTFVVIESYKYSVSQYLVYVFVIFVFFCSVSAWWTFKIGYPEK